MRIESKTTWMKSLKKLGAVLKETGFFLFLNALGIGFNLMVQSDLQDPFRIENGTPLYDWLFIVLALITFYFGVNITWLLMSRKNRSLGIGRLSIWLTVCMAWVIVVSRDPIDLKGFFEILHGTAYP